jgi:hypothetical protein
VIGATRYNGLVVRVAGLGRFGVGVLEVGYEVVGSRGWVGVAWCEVIGVRCLKSVVMSSIKG